MQIEPKCTSERKATTKIKSFTVLITLEYIDYKIKLPQTIKISFSITTHRNNVDKYLYLVV